MSRRVLLGLVLIVVIGVLPSSATAVGLCGVFYTYKTPVDTVTTANLNSNFLQAATTNSTPQCVQGDSATLTQMNAAVDPFPSGTASLATTLEGELQRIRFVLTRMHGATNWYTETQFSLGAGAGQMTMVSGTQIQFCPYNGNMFRIPSTAKTYQIPTACWTAANTSVYVGGVAATNLAASTTYWVYLFDLNGTPTFDFYTSSTHTPDSLTGIEIRTSDNTRVLIGLVRTNASSQFEADVALRGVISWNNRRTIGLTNGFSVNRTTTSATYVELNSEIRGNFVTWAEEAVTVGMTGGMLASASVGTVMVGFDGGAAEDNQSQVELTTARTAIGVAYVKSSLSEGFHFATVMGAIGAGATLTVYGAAAPTSTTQTLRTTLTVGIRG